MSSFSPRGGKKIFLRQFSKLTCLATLGLIFVGGLVKSTESGLAVPDWPLSYGTLFPPMVGGVLYEHGHRMAAALVGLMMLILAIGLATFETRRWVKNLGFAAFTAVMIQGLLGGLTVLLFLPAFISIAHGLLAQTFFVLTVILAYSQSKEREKRNAEKIVDALPPLKGMLIFIGFIYLQLFLGAVMRHTGSGLAIPDFPKMGGSWWPSFDAMMLNHINEWRFEEGLPFVTMGQVVSHFLHRIGALVILVAAILLTVWGERHYSRSSRIRRTIFYLDGLMIAQILLGMATVLSKKAISVTTFHVMIGAAVLGMAVLLLLRASPLSWHEFRQRL